jgi:hypothetical protein
MRQYDGNPLATSLARGTNFVAREKTRAYTFAQVFGFKGVGF